MLRVQVSLVYFASGFSKLIDPDWVSGVVLWDRVVRYQGDIHPAPGFIVDFLTWRPLFYLAAPVAIATELFLAVGLWLPRTRLLALRVAIVFHLAIELGASVEVFSLAAIAALAIWVTPAPRDRVDPARDRTRPGPDAGPDGAGARLAGPVPDRGSRSRATPTSCWSIAMAPRSTGAPPSAASSNDCR